jgi:hypothetical protein
MTRYSLVAILAFLSLILTACAGGGDEEVTQPAITEQPTSPTEAAPTRTPTITDNLFEFPDRGYSVRFPQGWTPMPDFLPGPGFSVDAFFGPEEIAGIKPNIAVTCEQIPEGMAPKDYFDQKVNAVRAVTQVEPEVSSREVSGQEARQLRFARQELEAPIEKTEVLFVTEKCGWSIGLTVPYGDRASYQDLLDEFLDSFRLLP